ncbi:HB2D protein, partial [Chloropsis hardwickii]|nr:HB2D protein [Chloropsis hardwickii]
APELCPALTGVFQFLGEAECHFINGTDRVRYVKRLIDNRVETARFDSDVGHYVGFTPFGEKQARHWNSDTEWMKYMRATVDRFCRHNSPIVAPFTAER